MEVKKKNIAAYKSSYLLKCDYMDLRAMVLSATVDSPVLALALYDRDLSYLTRRVKPTGDNCHMRAGIRIACAFFGVSDPFPVRSQSD